MDWGEVSVDDLWDFTAVSLVVSIMCPAAVAFCGPFGARGLDTLDVVNGTMSAIWLESVQ